MLQLLQGSPVCHSEASTTLPGIVEGSCRHKDGSESSPQRHIYREQISQRGGKPLASAGKFNVFPISAVMNFASIRPLGCEKESPSVTSSSTEGFS